MKELLQKLSVAFMTVLFFFMLYSIGYAASFTVERDGGINTLHYAGEVAEGDGDRLQRYIEQFDPVRIVLNSPGGVAAESFSLGFKLLAFDGVVEVNNKCLSACAIAFLAAPNKEINGGIVGFHAAWTPQNIDSNLAMKSGQILGLQMAYYLDKMGYTVQLGYLVTVLTDKDTFFVFTDVEDLDRFKGVDSVDLPEGYLGEHLAGPRRLQLLIGGD